MADTSLLGNEIGILIWKSSNYWQSRLRKVLNPYNLSLNEYFILQSINFLLNNKEIINQKEIASLIGIDISVTSVTLKSLEYKKYISRENMQDNRKKTIKMLKKGSEIIKSIYPLIVKEESIIFKKLNNETFNFTNSLKLLLGMKIRIKVNKKN